MDLGLGDKVALVSGGASNIGRAISMILAGEGAHVAILDRDEAQAERTAGDIAAAGGRASVHAVDVTDLAAVEAAVADIAREHGAPDVLVNNVGWNGDARFFLDLDPERWEKAYRLNLFPTFALTRAVLPSMRDRRAGAIVSIASDAAFGEFRVSDYGAMKAGVATFMRSIAKEYGKFGVRANTVAPGLVIPPPEEIGEGSLWQQQTGFGPKEIQYMEAGIPLKRRPEALDIAWTVAFLASERARMLTGQIVSVSGGFQMPR
jgi:NAD(P)-dependent dehydrogenase (short-subunit alcohol dehydrogenase family)